jgi:Na+/H+ antiporter NhaC
LLIAVVASIAWNLYVHIAAFLIFLIVWIAFYFILKREFKANRRLRYRRAKALYLQRLRAEREGFK